MVKSLNIEILFDMAHKNAGLGEMSEKATKYKKFNIFRTIRGTSGEFRCELLLKQSRNSIFKIDSSPLSSSLVFTELDLRKCLK